MKELATMKLGPLAAWAWAAIAAGAIALARARARARAGQPPGGGGPDVGRGVAATGGLRRMAGNVFGDGETLSLPLEAPPSSPYRQPGLVYDPVVPGVRPAQDQTPGYSPTIFDVPQDTMSADEAAGYVPTATVDVPSPTPESRPASSAGEIQSSPNPKGAPVGSGGYYTPPPAFTYQPPASPPASYTIAAPYVPPGTSPNPKGAPVGSGGYYTPPPAFTYQPPASPPASYTIAAPYVPPGTSPAPTPTLVSGVYRQRGGTLLE